MLHVVVEYIRIGELFNPLNFFLVGDVHVFSGLGMQQALIKLTGLPVSNKENKHSDKTLSLTRK